MVIGYYRIVDVVSDRKDVKTNKRGTSRSLEADMHVLTCQRHVPSVLGALARGQRNTKVAHRVRTCSITCPKSFVL
jgi:hypothetical protein